MAPRSFGITSSVRISFFVNSTHKQHDCCSMRYKKAHPRQPIGPVLTTTSKRILAASDFATAWEKCRTVFRIRFFGPGPIDAYEWCTSLFIKSLVLFRGTALRKKVTLDLCKSGRGYLLMQSCDKVLGDQAPASRRPSGPTSFKEWRLSQRRPYFRERKP